MNHWKFLFLTGEFAPREHILKGLTLEQVSTRPAGAPHSIFEELWHAATWQKLTLDQDSKALKRLETGGQFSERSEPESQAEWDDLVAMFLAYSERAAQLAEDEAWLESPATEHNTWRVELECLAVHNAYHMGKIVLLRQMMGIWEPASDDA